MASQYTDDKWMLRYDAALCLDCFTRPTLMCAQLTRLFDNRRIGQLCSLYIGVYSSANLCHQTLEFDYPPAFFDFRAPIRVDLGAPPLRIVLTQLIIRSRNQNALVQCVMGQLSELVV
jgi:hypothetical protein